MQSTDIEEYVCVYFLFISLQHSFCCCFAAISNSRGEYLLNGEFVVSMFKREIKVGEAVLEYSGSDHVIERINCTDRIDEEIVIQVTFLQHHPHNII